MPLNISYVIIISCALTHALYLFALPFIYHISITTALIALWVVITRRTWLLLLLIGSVLCIAWTSFSIQRSLNHQLPVNFTKQVFSITGVISAIKPADYGYSKGYKLTIQVEQAKHLETKEVIKLRNIQVYAKYSKLDSKTHYTIGQSGEWNIKLKPAHGFASHNSFNYEKFLMSEKIDATGSVKETLSLIENTQSSKQIEWMKLWQGVLHLNSNTSQQPRIDADIKKSTPLVYALITGDKSFLTQQQKNILQNTGTSHLFAISGMHLGMVALFINIILKLLSYILHPLSNMKLRLFIVLLCLVAFAHVTGWQAPITRALMMLSFLYAVWLNNIFISLWRIYIFSMAICLIINPLAVISLGFWLSFTAFFFIIVINTKKTARWHINNEPVQKSEAQRLHWKNSVRLHSALFFHFQCLIILFLLPITTYFFNQIAPASFICNLVAVPVMTLLIMPLILLSVISQQIYSLASDQLNYASAWLLENLFIFLAFIQNVIPIIPVYFSFVQMLIISLLFIAIYLLKSMRTRILCGLLITASCTLPSSKLPSASYQVSVLDIGQGLSVLIQTRNQTMLFDTGNKWSEYSDAMRFVGIPYLLHNDIKTLDHFVLSHGDSDHMGAYKTVDEYANIKHLWTGSGVNIEGNTEGSIKKDIADEISSCLHEHAWSIDGVTFQWLSASNKNGNENHQSCVLYIESPYGKTLIPSDIDIKRERLILKQYPNLSDIDLLLVPHHGSKTSSSNAFLKTLAPKHAIFSAGFANRYNHPHPKVTARYEKHNITSYNTANTGTIEFIFYKDQISIESYRANYPFWWVNSKM